LISDIDKKVKWVPLTVLAQTRKLLLGQSMQRESVQGSTSSSATTSLRDITPTARIFTEESLSLCKIREVLDGCKGRGHALAWLARVDMAKLFFSRDSSTAKRCRDLFGCELLLGLAGLHGLSLKSFTSLRNELCRQIAMQTKVDLDRNMKGEDAKIWLNEKRQRKRFSPFLDDVWGEGKLRRMQLADHSNSKVIVSSRDDRALR
jgi:hypothetical protein